LIDGVHLNAHGEFVMAQCVNAYLRYDPGMKTGTSLIRRNGPEGASHESEMSPFSSQGMVDGRFAKMKVRLPAGAEMSLSIVPTRKGSWQNIDDATAFQDNQKVGAVAWSQGNWIIQKDARCQAGTNHASETTGAHASLRFTGAAVRLIGQRAGNRGYVRIKIDDRDEGIFNLYSATPEYQVVTFERFGLPPGVHTLRVEASGLAGYGGGKYVDIDAIQVLKE
jgi:hypothetical protein